MIVDIAQCAALFQFEVETADVTPTSVSGDWPVDHYVNGYYRCFSFYLALTGRGVLYVQLVREDSLKVEMRDSSLSSTLLLYHKFVYVEWLISSCTILRYVLIASRFEKAPHGAISQQANAADGFALGGAP